jgi:hypothetical protein
MTFIQLCQRLVIETGIADSGPSSVINATGDMKRVVNWINDAWLQIQSMHRDWSWRWVEGDILALSDTKSLALPGAVECVFKLSYQGRELHKTEREFLSNSNEVTQYAIRPDGVILFNAEIKSGDLVQYEGCRAADLMQLDESEPWMPTKYHMIIVWKALMDYAIFDEAGELVQKAKMHYDKMEAELGRETLPMFESARSLA